MVLPDPVRRTLDGVRTRRRLVALLRWSGATAWVLVLCVLLRLVGGPEADLLGVRPLLTFAVAGSLTLAMAMLVPVFRRTADDLALAAAIDDRAPETADTLFTAVDLQRRAATTSSITDALGARAMEDASRRAPSVRPQELVPWASAGRSLPGGLLAAVALAAALLGGPAAWRDRLAATTEGGDKADGTDDAATLVLRNLRLRLVPPAYAQQEPLVLDGTTGDFDALVGTTVEFEAKVPAGSGARLWWGDAEADGSITLSGDRIEGRFVVPGGGFWSVELERTLGRNPLRTRQFRVGALKDGAPRLEVSGPGEIPSAEVGGTWVLDVRASDDHELGTLTWVLRHGSQEIASAPIAEVRSLPSWSGSVPFTMPDVVAGRSGALELLVVACDTADHPAPNCTRATALRTRLTNDEERRERSVEATRRLAEAVIDWLGPALVHHSGARPTTPEAQLRAEMDDERELARTVFELGAAATAAMRSDARERRDRFQGVTTILDNLGRRWSALDGAAARVFGDGRGLGPAGLQWFQEARAQMVAELERAVLDLGAIADQQRGERALAEAARATESLDRLEELAKAGEEGSPRPAEAQAALDALRRQMEALATQLREQLAGGPETFANRNPAETSESALDEIEQLMREGRWDEAAAKIAEAASAMDKLRDALAEQQGQSGSQAQEKLEEDIDAALAEAEALQEAQEDLQARTRATSGKDDPERARLLGEAQRLRDRVAALPRDVADPGLQRAIAQRTRQAVPAAEAVRDDIQRGEYEAAALEARDVAERLQELADDLGRDEPSRADRARAAAEAARTARQLADRLDAAGEPAPGRGPGQGGLAEEQGRLGERLQRLRERVDRIGGGAFNPAEGRELLERTGQSMRAAGQRLKAGEGARAAGSQGDAVAQLQQFRDAMGQARQGMGQQPMGPPSQPGSGQAGGGGQGPAGSSWAQGAFDDLRDDGGPGAGEVVMPREEDFVGPEALRALIQEGAAAESPDAYKPLQNPYFEEIAR